ncbi:MULTISPECIES: tRNA lysidine(34) synthetase TilS [Brevibacterium]|uniref:tRNA lysidine(34) synthetase TilS n=1 Tax=Brevibacterium TaxID=1696 RepID=UPI0035940A8D
MSWAEGVAGGPAEQRPMPAADGSTERRDLVGAPATPARPRLDPATAEVRRRLREFLASHLPEPSGAEPGEHPGHTFLLGVSGGADSMALATAAAFLQNSSKRPGPTRPPLRFAAVVVDHGLQSGSAAHTAGVVARLRAWGLEATGARVTVAADDPAGLEAAARTARYSALEARRLELGALAVLTAHTLDDQAETVLLGLARGAGARSLAGMRPVTGTVWRPLLGCARSVTRAACLAQGVQVWDDPMNEDPHYARVRARRTVLPLLERELGPGIARALARTADQLAADSDLLESQAAEAAHRLGADPAGKPSGHPGGLPGDLPAAASAEPAALRHRIIRDWLAAAGARQEVTHRHVLAVDELLMRVRHGAVSVPPGVSVSRVRGPDTERGALRMTRVSAHTVS